MMRMTTTTSVTETKGATGGRQKFSGADDVMLLRLVERSTPWSQRRGVMEAWQKVASALNADATSSLTNVSAPATRARFFRLVAQRRERQDAALRRTSTSNEQHAEKVELLDRLIARLDAHDEETALQDLLGRVDTDTVALQDSSAVPETSVVLSTRDKSVSMMDFQSPPLIGTSQEMNGRISYAVNGAGLMNDTSKYRAVQNASSILEKRPQSQSVRSITPEKTSPPPAKRVRTERLELMEGDTAQISDTLEDIAKGFIACLEQKLQSDQQDAQLERELRRQEMCLFASEMKATRNQIIQLMQQLIRIGALRT